MNVPNFGKNVVSKKAIITHIHLDEERRFMEQNRPSKSVFNDQGVQISIRRDPADVPEPI